MVQEENKDKEEEEGNNRKKIQGREGKYEIKVNRIRMYMKIRGSKNW